MNSKAIEHQELTPEEIKRLRALLKQDERVTWLWSTLGVWLRWGIIGGTFAAMIWNGAHKVFPSLPRIGD